MEIITNIKKSIMGTIQFDLKAKGHRGEQNFVCYPISKEDKTVKIQSSKRIGIFNPEIGLIELSKSRPGGSYFMHLSFDKLVTIQLSKEENEELKAAIFKTASSEAGKEENGYIQSDNSGAINII